MFINFLNAYNVFNEIFPREVLVTPFDVQFRKFLYIFVCLLIWCQCFLFFSNEGKLFDEMHHTINT